MSSENAVLAHRLQGARRAGEWLVAPLPRFPVQRHWPRRVILIGNAAAAVEPIGGEGMGLAMRSAELAASELIRSNCERGGGRVHDLHRSFDRLWRVRRLTCRMAALAISSPRIANVGIRRLNAWGGLPGQVLRLMGKAE
jgi:2-polyprenyl-6-methoxyphenol hydroxylase-like FAD-dependent oxidoreductase